MPDARKPSLSEPMILKFQRCHDAKIGIMVVAAFPKCELRGGVPLDGDSQTNFSGRDYKTILGGFHAEFCSQALIALSIS